MRYNNVPIITYTDKDNNKYPVKDIKEIGTYKTGVMIKVENGMMLDDIASRKEYYGENNEYLAYAIFDHNIIELTEADFVLSKLKNLKLPVIEEL